MNYIAYRIVEKEYSENLFLWMTMGHFQDHYQEFREYARWIHHHAWDDIYTMIRDLYKVDYSMYGTFRNYIECSTYSNHPMRWSILLQTMLYSIGSSIASSDTNCTTLESSSIEMRKKYIDAARYKYSFYCIRQWFRKIQEHILNNPFQTVADRNILIDIVCRVYRVHLGLKRLVRIWRWKRSCKNMITTTLEFEPLESLPPRRIIEINEQNSRYKFDCLELRKLWVQGLLENEHFFSEPKELLNPYTNIKFSKPSLWNLYVHLRWNGFVIHETIENYVKCSMDIELFRLRYEAMLRNYTIEQHFRDMRRILHKPVAKMTPTEKYLLYEDYKLLIQLIHSITTNYEPFEAFYYESLASYQYDTIQEIVKDCISIVENYYRKCYSYNVSEKQVNSIQCKENILKYLKDENNYFNRWYLHVYVEEHSFL